MTELPSRLITALADRYRLERRLGGWYLVRTRGSHRQFRHPARPGLVTIAGKPGATPAPGTANSILKQAGLKP